ncbi:hypothetical protein [Amycolatopsis sp. NPDC004079]|uniref:hypothetical protein n=1 Tax=Amycolatopsis sp. NPDC004079 TaxID=3154549 RepID=UPI0033AAFB53
MINAASSRRSSRAAAIRLPQSDRLRLESGGPDLPQRLATALQEPALQHDLDWTVENQVELLFDQAELAGFARVSRRRTRCLRAARTAPSVTITGPRALRELAAPPEED